jgi:acetylornithine deacetylase/succinyl-diaminopimelate desuccinylase-like protein
MIEGGHAPNALPQRVRATVNCRILPDQQPAAVEKALAGVIGDAISIAPIGRTTVSRRLAPEGRHHEACRSRGGRDVARQSRLCRSLSAGGTDRTVLEQHRHPCVWRLRRMVSPVDTNTHGLNERFRVAALYEGRSSC